MANETKVYVALMYNEPFANLDDAIKAVANSLKECNERYKLDLPCFVSPFLGQHGEREWRVYTLNHKGNLIYRTIREKTMRSDINAEVQIYPIYM